MHLSIKVMLMFSLFNKHFHCFNRPSMMHLVMKSSFSALAESP